ncbi:MAG: hypothetical protein [Cressdnaviricota sp.]|nr:MAG: hypothetical protein [Cressdnaviricota sp.]
MQNAGKRELDSVSRLVKRNRVGGVSSAVYARGVESIRIPANSGDSLPRIANAPYPRVYDGIPTNVSGAQRVRDVMSGNLGY